MQTALSSAPASSISRVSTHTAPIEGLDKPASLAKAFSYDRKLVLPASGVATTWQDVYRFWFGDGPVPIANYGLWFGCAARVDAVMKETFGALFQEAVGGGLRDWEDQPQSCVAKVLLVSQFPRHMFRGSREAISHDDLARRLTERCVELLDQGGKFHFEDLLIIAWPWFHSEELPVLNRALKWIEGLRERTRGTPYHFRALFHHYGINDHIEVIERFGRYPHRNVLLGRTSTPEELTYLREEAYMWELSQDPDARCAGGTPAYNKRLIRFNQDAVKHLWKLGAYGWASLLYLTIPFSRSGYTGGL